MNKDSSFTDSGASDSPESSSADKSEINLLDVMRPSRYINNEINAIHRDMPLRMALAFPDVYDVGMSHLGLKILYHIVNAMEGAVAERVFHPWVDMEQALRDKGEPLRSLESGLPFDEFDIIGFSLQYELCYTSVLNMLELGNIPKRSAERNDTHPLVIAGGPCTINPAPVAPFFDALLMGDGEDAVPEIVALLMRLKREGDGKRETALRELAKIEGVYVPQVHDGSTQVKRRYVDSLEDAPYPTSPVVPYAEVVHDRIAIEVSRGCTQGCRFCQAGMLYRPLRERSPQKILELATEALKNTGHDEVSFVSLSTGDYCGLFELIKGFNSRFKERRISVSLPSLRVASVNQDVLREISSVRKTGFTIAPEAATDRLRSVINKNLNTEDFERAVTALFKEGWLNLKLYYMIGLPTEEQADIEAIPQMVQIAQDIARKHARKKPTISISVSPFVPKSHTPFQWEGQASREYIAETQSFLRSKLRRFNFRTHDVDTSVLEAAFARGDGKMAELIEAAHAEGARLDAWTEEFSMERWQRAMDKTGIDVDAMAQHTYPIEGELPWDVVDTGINKSFLKRERELSIEATRTRDCTESCTGCGLKCRDDGKAGVSDSAEYRAPSNRPLQPKLERAPIKIRVKFSKTGTMRYLSHRELITHVTRALMRTGLRLSYSQGFHPAPKIAFGPPLGVGVAGTSEYLDMEIIPLMALAEIKVAANKYLAEGVEFLEVKPLHLKVKSLQAFVSKYVYEVRGSEAEGLDAFMDSKEHMVKRKKGAVDVRPMVEHIEVLEPTVTRLILKDVEGKKIRVDEMARAIFGKPASELDITRVAMYGQEASRGAAWTTPLPE